MTFSHLAGFPLRGLVTGADMGFRKGGVRVTVMYPRPHAQRFSLFIKFGGPVADLRANI